MNEIQAISIALIGVLSIHIWARWMSGPGEEWPITEWIRRHWQCVTGGRVRGGGWQKCERRFKA